ncbi:Nn.00g106640.m01.CDS01 [Neocucurbitaria sp. VM-36]
MLGSMFFLFCALISPSLAKSQIALFSDTNCQESLRGLEGPNGYPNGTCTDLRRSGPYGSFHVVGLDPGCTVTIYANDTTEDICSGYQEEIRPVDCYNSSFVYYSIDFCDPGAAQELPSSAPTSSSGTPTSAIVGGVVGGVLGLCIILGLVIYMIRKRRAKVGSGTPYAGETAQVDEWYAQHAGPQELPTHMLVYKRAVAEVEQPPVELAGREMMTTDARP